MKTILLIISIQLSILIGADAIRRPRLCYLKAETGTCKALFLRWYFNARSKQCSLFNYGGCEGNKNNFETELACKTVCRVLSPCCYLPAEVGPCRAAINRYFYNPDTFACQLFSYGGCGGNTNNFETIEKCQKTCS